MDKETYLPSVESSSDKTHRTIRGIIGLSPVGSGTILEVFNSLWQPPAEARAEAWMSDVIDAINSLSDKQNRIETLISSPEFQSLLINANQLILKHHQPEKINFFKNVVINCISFQSIGYDKKSQFLNMLDQLTITHIQILNILKDGLLWGLEKNLKETKYTYFIARRIIEIQPSIGKDFSFIDKLLQDLYQYNLFSNILVLKGKVDGDILREGRITNIDLDISNLNISVSELPETKYAYFSNLSQFGEDFIAYISDAAKQPFEYEA
ncbi:hypothetical protein ACS0KD_004307 [Vibrio vulnificus]|nr:hypothetical protein [Vibrio vulnificus]